MKWEFTADVQTQDWIGCDLNDHANLEDCVHRLVQHLETELFAWWEVIVREEQGMRPIELLCEVIEQCDPEEIRPPRPTLPWYEIVRQIVPRMLFDPFEPKNHHQREIAACWPLLAAAIEEHGYGLSLPGGVSGPLDVVPDELRDRLWQQFALIEPLAPQPTVDGCQIIPLERIFPFITHTDPVVRDTAAWYASRFHCGEAAVTNQVVAAMEQYGSPSAFRRSMFLSWLTFDQRQFSRLLGILARDCADPDSDTIAMGVMLDGMAPELLAPHREAVLALPWDRLSRRQLTDRIDYHQAEPDEVWEAFVREIQRFEEVDDRDFDAFSEGMLGCVADNLLQDPRLEKWVMEILGTSPAADNYSPIRERAAICLAGKLRLEQSVPLLIRRMHRHQGLYYDDLEISLAEIRTDSVVSEFHQRLRWAGTMFCQTAINALADTYTPLSQATLRCWLESFHQWSERIRREEEEADEDLDAWELLATIDRHVDRVLLGMVRQLMPDGLAAAQEFIEQGKADSELCEMTIAACTILNVDFPGRDLAEEIINFDADEYLDDDNDGDDEYDSDEYDGEADEWMTDGATRSVIPMGFDEGPPVNQPFKRSTARVGRNAPCPCGSGKKFKNCCMRK